MLDRITHRNPGLRPGSRLLSSLLLPLLAVLAAFSGAEAQDPNYILSCSHGSIPATETVTLSLQLDSTAGSNVQAMQIGLCVDPTYLIPTGAAAAGSTLTADGVFPAIYPDGVTLGVLMSFLGTNPLPPGDHLVGEVTFAGTGTIGAPITPVAFCNTLGNPPINTVVTVGGSSLVPIKENGSITLNCPSGVAPDCNCNGLDDFAEIASGAVTDCNLNGVPDDCDVAAGIVVDAAAPVISGMPASTTHVTGAGVCTAIVTWPEPSVSDDCAIAPVVTSSHSSGDTFPIGITTVVYTAVDDFGNSASASFDITVADRELPVIGGVPGTIAASTDAGLCTAAVTWSEPTVTDNCVGPTVTSSHSPGDTFPLGSTTVTYTAADASG
ncbi:MAG: HYR domain-containing protein, partial [Planctomycetota bacterium]